MESGDRHRREFRAVREALDDFLASDESERLVPLADGSTMRFTRDADAPGGVRIGADGEVGPPPDIRTFHADTRPRDYPDEVPFLSDVPTMITFVGEPARLFAVVWMMVPDPAAGFRDVVDWHRGAGWTEATGEDGTDGPSAGEPDHPEPGFATARASQRIRLEKDGVRRGLSVMELSEGPGVVNLFARPLPGD